MTEEEKYLETIREARILKKLKRVGLTLEDAIAYDKEQQELEEMRKTLSDFEMTREAISVIQKHEQMVKDLEEMEAIAETLSSEGNLYNGGQ